MPTTPKATNHHSSRKFPIFLPLRATQPVQTLFLFKSIWIRPQGSQGCQKIRFFFSQIKLFSFCAKIAPKRHKLQKSSKLKKKCQKTLVFFDFFESSSFWGLYQRAKPQIACLVDPGAPFDTPGTPGAGSIQNISRFQYLFLIFLSGGAPYNFFQLIQNKV